MSVSYTIEISVRPPEISVRLPENKDMSSKEIINWESIWVMIRRQG